MIEDAAANTKPAYLLIGNACATQLWQRLRGKVSPAYSRQSYGARRVPLVPFLFEGFAADHGMFQPDGIHPIAAAAQEKMLDNVWPHLRPLLAQAAKR